MLRTARVAAIAAMVAAAVARAQAPVPAPVAPSGAAAVPEPVRRAAGCYALEPGPWERDSALAWRVPVARLPRHFRLVPEPLPAGSWTARYRVALVPPDTAAFLAVSGDTVRALRPLSAWEVRRAPDTLWIGTALPGFAGEYLRLWPAHGGAVGELAGTLTGWTEDRPLPADRPSEVTRPVRARRIPCAAPGRPAGPGAGAA